jgi:Holliday junction resolvase
MDEKGIVRLTLPYPPSVNHYYSRTTRGVFINKSVRLYREEVLLTCKNQVKESFFGDAVKMEIYLYCPDKRKRDIDNILKCTLDVIQMLGVYIDDNQISKLSVIRKPIIKNGKIHAIIERLSNDEIESTLTKWYI